MRGSLSSFWHPWGVGKVFKWNPWGVGKIFWPFFQKEKSLNHQYVKIWPPFCQSPNCHSLNRRVILLEAPIETGLLAALKVSARLGWFIQEVPSFVVPAVLCMESYPQINMTQMVVMTMFMAHYFNRSIIYPLRIFQAKDTPIFIVLAAFVFCSFNGFLQAHYVLHVVQFQPGEVLKPSFVFGVVVFAIGFLINNDSDRRLRLLRATANSDPKERYKIPRGGMFEYVSSANYFGEIVEWWGFALVARLNPGALFFAGFTTIFLGLRGIDNHKWYLEKFGDKYPSKRRAVIPFLV